MDTVNIEFVSECTWNFWALGPSVGVEDNIVEIGFDFGPLYFSIRWYRE